MSQPGASNPFAVVGIGASAGGLTPLKELLSALPPKPGLAFVVVQHLDPHAESHLASLLQSHTAMQVTTATHGQPIDPNHLYVIQPNTYLAVADGVLSVTPRPDDRRPYYPIDHCFRSLAMAQGPHAIGVVLSGTGSDGTLGVCEIKAAGGVTFAQDNTAQHPGMPKSAVESGAIDLVLSAPEIGERIAELPQHPLLSGQQTPEQAVADGEDFRRVIAALRSTSGVDFSQYRDTTIKRRTARRMLLRGLRTPAAYAQMLETDRTEADALYRDVLINVTSFFRDAEMFDTLRQRVIPEIVKSVPDGHPVRVWVPGCSTGQEAYSLAMVLVESASGGPAGRPVQVFATDIGDAASLDYARAGVYPESIEAEVSPERLRRFFVKDGGHYRVQKFLRDCCVFARQNITIDPPFSRVDLVSCRNVLIYMSSALQERLLPLFHFALNRNGFLVLGLAETVGRHHELFEVFDRQHKIFQRKEAPRRAPLMFMTGDWIAERPGRPARPTQAPAAEFQRDADRIALEAYAPPSVLVNEDFEIQQYRGRTSPFLEVPAGQPTTSILRMVREGLLMDLRSALTEAKVTRTPVVREGLRVPDGTDGPFTLRILPISRTGTDEFRLLIIFETPGERAPAPAAIGTASDHDVAWLRQELAATKLYLQAVIDDQDSATQELRAAHEEVLSSNEELQSTNEELETTKEELQSANEELTTINEQFEARNQELDALTDDITNFIGSADLPMATVGRDLRIRRVTPAAQRAFNLLPSDVGRSIEHIKFAFDLDRVDTIVDQVITSMRPFDTEIRDRAGHWWLLQVRPFVTSDNRIDGATLVAVDVDLVLRSRELLEARDYALAIVRTVREPLVVLDADCRIGLANEAFYRLFGETPEAITGKLLWETGRGVWNDPALRQQLQGACEGTLNIENLEFRRVIPGVGDRTLTLNAQAIVREGRPALLLLAVEDVTDARQAEALRIDAETLRQINQRKDEFLGILAHELRNPLAPMRFALEILRQHATDPDAAGRARLVLDRQVAHMSRIVDDLLDVSRITQGKVELRKERVALADIVAAAVEFCEPAVDAARHTLTVSLPDDPIVINGDAVRLTQVLVNLLNNAIKFTTPVGHIWVIAEYLAGSAGAPDSVRIRVRDTGIGIPPEMRQKVFDMFTQGDRTLERGRGGLGVGLTLVRNLVALHGGTVEARSEGIDRGSEFVVMLPVEPPAAAAAAAASVDAATRTEPLRVLLADDDEDGRAMLSYLLMHAGHQVIEAEDGQQALAAAAREAPEVVLLDLSMPVLNGFEVARRLRELAGGDRMVLIAMSGLGQAADKTRATEAGFDRHFTKPVELAALLTAILEGRKQRG